MKLAAIIVLYNPNIDDIKRNLQSYANEVDLLIIWDNSTNPQSLSDLLTLYPNAIINQNGCNYGLATAYNKGIDIATQYCCSHIMTMDQDSSFANFEKYRTAVETSSLDGITCTAINDECVGLTSDTTVIGYSCQSGSIYPLSLIKTIGPFREDLFIGMVDAEISIRAQEFGYTITRFNKCKLIHQIGSGRKVKVFGHDITVSDYNALRHYYDSRNRILLWHQFPNDYSFPAKIKHLWGRIKLIIKIIIFEQNKISKTWAILVGTIYGICNKSVPYKDTQIAFDPNISNKI